MHRYTAFWRPKKLKYIDVPKLDHTEKSRVYLPAESGRIDAVPVACATFVKPVLIRSDKTKTADMVEACLNCLLFILFTCLFVNTTGMVPPAQQFCKHRSLQTEAISSGGLCGHPRRNTAERAGHLRLLRAARQLAGPKRRPVQRLLARAAHMPMCSRPSGLSAAQ